MICQEKQAPGVETAMVSWFDPRQGYGRAVTRSGDKVVININACRQVKDTGQGPFLSSEPFRRVPRPGEEIKFIRSGGQRGIADRWGYLCFWNQETAPVVTVTPPAPASTPEKTAPAKPAGPARSAITDLDRDLGLMPSTDIAYLEALARGVNGRNHGKRPRAFA